MLTKSVLAAASLALFAASVQPPPQGGNASGAGGIGLLNCDIDLRRDDQNEAQVFWTAGTAANGWGFKFDVWDRHSDVIQAGNAEAENELLLKSGGANTVVFTYDKAKNKVNLVITDKNGKKQDFLDMEPIGTFSAIGPAVEPVKTQVRRDSGEKRRFLITAGNYGLTYSFTISDV